MYMSELYIHISMKKYEFFDHTADVLFQAYGKTLVELCTNAALALQDVQVKLSTVGAKRKKTIEITAQTPEKLLFDFLQELVFVKDVNQLLFSKFNIKIVGTYKLTAQCFGEKINFKKHELNVDAKAITMHQFEVSKKKTGWKARVIVDI